MLRLSFPSQPSAHSACNLNYITKTQPHNPNDPNPNPNPQVSSAAFRAFSCDRFDNGREYLRADYSLECSTATHFSEEQESLKRLAWLSIFLYPVGISLVYALLFLCARRSILQDRPTPLSKALDFLVRDFEPGYFWWEVQYPSHIPGHLL